MPETLLIATNNPGKVIELRDLIGPVSCELLTLADFPAISEVPETGNTFDENARIKAIGYAKRTGRHALADDSGLCVDVLDGRPGVLSARYGGEETSFADKMALLLAEVSKKDSASRRARFVCSITIAAPDGVVLAESKGICEGNLARSPRGIGGFGYDPLFIPDGFNETFGELDAAVKARISHRAQAFQEIIPFLRHFMLI